MYVGKYMNGNTVGNAVTKPVRGWNGKLVRTGIDEISDLHGGQSQKYCWIPLPICSITPATLLTVVLQSKSRIFIAQTAFVSAFPVCIDWH